MFLKSIVLSLIFVCAFSPGARGAESADLIAEIRKTTHSWALQNAKFDKALHLTADQIETRDGIFQFYADYLEKRARGERLRDMRAEYITARAGELYRLQKIILMSWDSAPQRQQDYYHRSIFEIEKEIGQAEQDLRDNRLGEELLKKRLKLLRKNKRSLQKKIDAARPQLDAYWEQTISLMQAMNETLDFHLKDEAAITYETLFTHQILTSLVFNAAHNHFYMSPVPQRNGVLEWEDAHFVHEFDICAHLGVLEEAMKIWKSSGQFPLRELPVVFDNLMEIDHQAARGHLVLPVMKQLAPELELAFGYLPVSTLRFKITGLNFQVPPKGLSAFERDLLNLDDEVSKWDFTPLKDIGTGLVAVDESLKTWLRLVDTEDAVDAASNVVPLFRKKKTEAQLINEEFALTLLHFARFGAVLRQDFKEVAWFDVHQVIKSFAQDYLMQRPEQWNPQRRFFNVQLIDDLMQTGTRPYQSLAPDLDIANFYPDEMAKGLDILVARLLGDRRFSPAQLDPFEAKDVLERAPVRLVSTRLQVLREKYDFREALDVEPLSPEECESGLKND